MNFDTISSHLLYVLLFRMFVIWSIQVTPAGSTKDTEEHNKTQREAISCSNGNISSQGRADGTFSPK